MKIIYTLLLIFLLPVFVYAQIIPDTIYAATPVTLTNESLKQSDIIELYTIKTGKLTKNINLDKGEKIQITIIKYIKPKRGKRNGYYNVVYNGKESMNGTMRISTPVDVKNLTAKAGMSAAGFLLNIPLVPQAVAAAKGIVKPNENQNRIQSAGHNIYESTPLTYVEKGTDFFVEKDGVVVIRLKPQE